MLLITVNYSSLNGLSAIHLHFNIWITYWTKASFYCHQKSIHCWLRCS